MTGGMGNAKRRHIRILTEQFNIIIVIKPLLTRCKLLFILKVKLHLVPHEPYYAVELHIPIANDTDIHNTLWDNIHCSAQGMRHKRVPMVTSKLCHVIGRPWSPDTDVHSHRLPQITPATFRRLQLQTADQYQREKLKVLWRKFRYFEQLHAVK